MAIASFDPPRHQCQQRQQQRYAEMLTLAESVGRQDDKQRQENRQHSIEEWVFLKLGSSSYICSKTQPGQANKIYVAVYRRLRRDADKVGQHDDRHIYPHCHRRVD
ncbi:MAG: hypothetical protein AB7I34_22285, partial [Rhizobiaceae bacterium]